MFAAASMRTYTKTSDLPMLRPDLPQANEAFWSGIPGPVHAHQAHLWRQSAAFSRSAKVFPASKMGWMSPRTWTCCFGDVISPRVESTLFGSIWGISTGICLGLEQIQEMKHKPTAWETCSRGWPGSPNSSCWVKTPTNPAEWHGNQNPNFGNSHVVGSQDPPSTQVWEILESYQKRGIFRSLGVCNFDVTSLQLLEQATPTQTLQGISWGRTLFFFSHGGIAKSQRLTYRKHSKTIWGPKLGLPQNGCFLMRENPL